MNIHKGMSLEERVQTLEDIDEIRRLRALYCYYNDGGWPEHGPSHAGPCAELYTDDGIWDGTPFMPVMKGREQIRKGIEEAAKLPFVIHYVMNPVIDVDGDQAKGHWHVIACTTQPDHSAHWQLGYYFEEYRRTKEGWRFSMTRFVTARVFPEETGWHGAPPFEEIAAMRAPKLGEPIRSKLALGR